MSRICNAICNVTYNTIRDKQAHYWQCLLAQENLKHDDRRLKNVYSFIFTVTTIATSFHYPSTETKHYPAFKVAWSLSCSVRTLIETYPGRAQLLSDNNEHTRAQECTCGREENYNEDVLVPVPLNVRAAVCVVFPPSWSSTSCLLTESWK